MNSYGALLCGRSFRIDGAGGACVCVHTQHTTLPQLLLWLVFCPPSTPLFSDRAGTFHGFPLWLPWPAGLPSFARIGQRLLSMLRLGISSASPCSARPCGPASPAAAAQDFNTEFPPATFPGRRRSCRLVGQSEFRSGADSIFRAVSGCLTTRSAETRIGAGPSALGHRRWGKDSQLVTQSTALGHRIRALGHQANFYEFR